jgi:Mg-chelatase subunit ChlD
MIGRALGIVLAALLASGTALSAQAPAPTGVDYALLIDNTGTMRYGERGAMTLTALDRFINAMEPGDRLSVFSYGEVARPVLSSYPVEIRDDASKESIRKELAFAFDADRTDITAGVDLVWRERERVFPGHYGGRRAAVLVLLTDGKLVPVYGDYSEYERTYQESRSRLRDLARAFGEDGIPIHAVGLGSSEKIDVAHLKSIAEWSGGASYHVTAARELPDVYAGIWEATRPEVAVVAVDEQSSEPPRLEISESASAREHTPRPADVARPSAPIGAFDLASRAATGAIAVFLGLVVIGTRKRQAWTQYFTRAIGPQEQRVRGYLKPVDPPGTQMARAIIGLENPGLPTLEIGCGTEYASFATNTLIEFIGTRDGTAPTICVHQGEVTVDGELVSEERALRDGAILSFEGGTYMYLRGSRK